MIWKLAEAGMNVARMNMSHGDHASHKKVIDLVKEYNAQTKDNTIAIMLDTKVCFCFLFIYLLESLYVHVSPLTISFIVHRVRKLGVEIYLSQLC